MEILNLFSSVISLMVFPALREKHNVPLWRGRRGRRESTGVVLTSIERQINRLKSGGVALIASITRNVKGLSSPYAPSKGGHSFVSHSFAVETKQNYMKIFASFFICCFALATPIIAQQVEEFSLMQENAFILNPAYAGTEGFVHGQLTFRKQFMQIEQSPYTALATATGLIIDKHIGLGGYVMDDVTGPTSKIEACLGGAYNLNLQKKRTGHYSNGTADHMLSIGLSVSFVQYRIDGSQLLAANPSDPKLFTSTATKMFPDASFGLLYKWKDQLYAGVSVPQIMGLNINYVGNDGTASIKTVQQFDMMLGGKYAWDRDKFSIDPYGAFRREKGAPAQGDIGLRFNMLNFFWVGAAYRSLNDGIFMAGLNYKDIVTFAYAYTVNLTYYRTDIGATHEFTLGFTVPKVSKIWRGVGPALRF